MRTIRFLVVHCTATAQTATVASIQRYWRETLKWRSQGYHILITPDGTPHRLATDSAICNGVAGQNSHSLHVSYIGGVDSRGRAVDNRTEAQKATLLRIVTEWKRQHPNAVIQGHRDFPTVRKSCPSFNAKAEYAGVK
jgi:N-acetylmuramoyl-L-alanine amidase